MGQSELKQLGGEAQQFVETITSLKLIVEVVSGCFVVSEEGLGFFMEHMDDTNKSLLCVALRAEPYRLLIE